MEEIKHVEEGSSPNRIEVVMVGRRESVIANTVYDNVYDQLISCSPGSNVS